MGKYEVKNEPGKTFTQDYDITGFGPDFTIVVADYACNETEIDVSLYRIKKSPFRRSRVSARMS